MSFRALVLTQGADRKVSGALETLDDSKLPAGRCAVTSFAPPAGVAAPGRCRAGRAGRCARPRQWPSWSPDRRLRLCRLLSGPGHVTTLSKPCRSGAA